MANKPPAFQFYVKDWLSSESVVVMTAEQRGWYIQLLCHAWNGEPIATLPTDDRKLKALAGAGDGWAADKQAVLECFEAQDGRLVNRKLAEQHQALQEYHNERSEAGRKGNEKRWRKDRSAIEQQSQSDRKDVANDRPSTASSTSSSNSTPVQFGSVEQTETQSFSQTGEDQNPLGLQSLVDVFDILAGVERDIEDPAYANLFGKDEQRLAATGIDPDKLASMLLWAYRVSNWWVPNGKLDKTVETFCRAAKKIETSYDNYYAKAAKKPHEVRDKAEVLRFLTEPREEAAAAPERIKTFEICDDCGGTPCTCKLCPNCHKPLDADGVCRRTFCLED